METGKWARPSPKNNRLKARKVDYKALPAVGNIDTYMSILEFAPQGLWLGIH